MTATAIDARALAQSGIAALRAGDAHSARAIFERIAAAGYADASSHLALAYACSRLGDHQAAIAAADQALLLEPRHVRALIFKADCLDAIGDPRGALHLYRSALESAQSAAELPPDLQAELGRARAKCDEYALAFEAALRERVGAGAALAPHGRFAQSLDILFGKKRVYFQQPLNYYFPELPQIQFYDRSVFPWFAELEAATPAIKAELVEVMREDAKFRPYVQSDGLIPRREQEGMLNNPAWSAFYLWKSGSIVADNAARCPRTLEALRAVPAIELKNRTPSVLFSLLRPGAHIPPHHGRMNTRLICHLPLIVPGNCQLRVGNEIREVEEGKAWAFDDTIEHEAWNRSGANRVVLIFEIWRPELSDGERAQIAAMFEAIDAQSGERPAWDI